MNSTVIENKDYRIDSQFYTKKVYKNLTLNYVKIGQILKKSQYGISIEMNENFDGYPIYRMNEIHSMMCNLTVNKYACITNDELQLFKLNDRDVLFNRTNSFEWVGRTGLYKETFTNEFIFASYLVRFVPDYEHILPEYLTAFLNCQYGAHEVKRRARQSINQTNVNPEEVKEIEIPLLNIATQQKIKKCFDDAHYARLLSKQLYTEAETLLLQELDLLGFKSSTENMAVKKFSESFGTTGRLDAEYYQDKYEEILKKVRSYSHSYKILREAVNIKEKNCRLNDKAEYKYIELSNVDNLGKITGHTLDNGKGLPTRARRVVNTGDVIVSSIEGSLSSVALIDNSYNNAICSTGFYVISSDLINPETLLLLIKSPICQAQLQRACSGTILTSINSEDFKSVIIPIIRIGIQNKIQKLVQQSSSLRLQSNLLLEIAKQAVEMAIEQNEEIALKWLGQNTSLSS